MASKADEYRAKARECEERAEQTRDHFIKKQLTRNSAEVAAYGCSRRKACALGRLAPPPWPVCGAFSIPGASGPAGFANDFGDPVFDLV